MALGKENVIGIMMPSKFSSKESIEDATRLADNLGIQYRIIPIMDAYEAYLETLKDEFRNEKEDVTEENIQARIRGNILMALSNKFGYLVLSCGNKSELSIGYSTLYGDMAGGLAVISDVPKLMVYDLARYINKNEEIIPERVLIKEPSAELREGQKDKDDIPTYDILDPILHAYIEENRNKEEITAMGFDRRIVDEIIWRIDHNEYKRKQAPIGIKITPRAFGFGRRMPIVNKYH
jgi:NAD+ synthase (glutamine-hydrolysing)